MEGVIVEGGCFCGAIRYRGMLADARVHFCHCSDCRRSSGAPFLAWANFDADEFELTAGSPGCYESRNDAGARVRRQFCNACGTQMTYQRPDDSGGGVWVTVCSLDEPEQMTPGEHLWTVRWLDWLRLDDGLPRHERGFPEN